LIRCGVQYGEERWRWTTKHPFRFAYGILAFAYWLVAFGLIATSDPTAAAQQPSGISQVRGTLTGPRFAVFDTSKDACELIDIPDAPARAFVDSQGMVHLVSSHYVMRASIGPTLETVKHNCEVAYRSHHDPNPAHWDDNTWLDSFFSIDGTNVVALGHMEYHGWEHPGECYEQGNYSAACWYNGDTFHLSHDGGYHFGSFKPPANYILSVPYRYIVNSGPEGYSIDTNIVKAGGWYYAVVTGWGWPANCFFEYSDCLVYGGAAPIRTSDITDPTSWRGWNGQDFSVTFDDPYLGPIASPFEHIFFPVPTIAYVNAINFHPASNLFVATLFDPFNNYYGPPGIYLSTSPDLINWSQPTLLVTIADLLAKEPPGIWTYGYASLLDPDSTDPNFSTIGDIPYLYYVRSDANDCCYVRVLYRQRIKLTWK
jgi:hypothetical protein